MQNLAYYTYIHVQHSHHTRNNSIFIKVRTTWVISGSHVELAQPITYLQLYSWDIRVHCSFASWCWVFQHRLPLSDNCCLSRAESLACFIQCSTLVLELPINEKIANQCDITSLLHCGSITVLCRYLEGKIKAGEAHNILCPEYGCYKLVPLVSHVIVT